MRLGKNAILAAAGAAALLLVLVPLGAAAGADVTLSATSLTFADRPVGTTADAQTIQVANTGDAPLMISSVHIDGADAGDFGQGTACPVNPDKLASGATCSIYVSFTPHSAGPKTATLAIGDDAGSSPQTVALSGGGVLAPRVRLTPDQLAFGTTLLGDHAPPQTVTVENTGSANLSLSAIRIAGADAAHFSRTTTCDLGAGLAAGASCTVDVTFTPQSVGAKAASLTLDDDASSSPQSVALTGTGAAPAVPGVGLGANSLSFGSQNVGTTSAPQQVSVTNTGGAPLAIQGIDVTPDFAQTSDCPASLGAGASCTVSVTFSPSATGARAGTLTVADDASGSPQHVALAGTGLAEGTWLADDFESGSLSQWDALSSSASTIAPDSTLANSGSGSVRFTNASGNQSSRLYANLAGGGHAQSYTRFCFRIGADVTGGIEIANGRAITALYPLGIRRWVVTWNPVTHGLEAYFFNEDLQRLDLYAANGRVLPEQWHCAEVYLDQSVNGRAELFLDGASVGSVTGDLGTPDPYGRLYLWNQPDAGTVWFDDVKVASTPSGPVGAAVAGRPRARAALAAAAVRFGAQTAGTTSPSQTVTLSNTGIGPMAIAGIAVTDDFGQTNTCPASLPAGASCTVSVTFSPSATGPRAGTLTVTDDSPDGSQTVALSGTGLAPGTYLADDFESGLAQWDVLSSSGSTVAADSSVANSGGGSVRISNASTDQSSRLMADLAGGPHSRSYTRFCFEIAPGLTQGIEIANGRAITAEYPLGIRRWEITYNPVTKGLEGYFFNDALQRLDLYAANGAVLTGRWYCAELYLDESTNGRAQLWLNGASVGSVTGDLGTPDPYSRLYLWNQPSAGTVWFDDVRVADSQIGPVGAGAAALPGPQAAASPSTLTFASRTTGTTSAGQTVTLTNTGAAPLTIGNVAVTGANAGDFAQTNTCPATLAVGASCTATVTFTPAAAGARTASLTFTDNAPDAPQAVALSGTGTAPAAPAVTYAPTSLDFGNQVRGTTSAQQTVTITNTGTQNVSFALGKVDQGNDFSAGSTCNTLVPGASCTWTVSFRPTMAGARSANLVISTSAATLRVGLAGTGTFAPGTYFMDDFAYGIGAWTRVGSSTIAPGTGRNGTSGGILQSGAGAYVDFATQGQAETHTRFCFDPTTATPGATTLAQGRNANGLNLWEIDYDGGRHGLSVYLWDGARARSDFYPSNVVAVGSWYCVDVDLNQAASGGASVSLDGTTIASVSGNFGTAADYSRLLLWNSLSVSYSVDDVSVTAN